MNVLSTSVLVRIPVEAQANRLPTRGAHAKCDGAITASSAVISSTAGAVDSALMTHVPVTPPHACHRHKDWAVLASSHMQPDMVISLAPPRLGAPFSSLGVYRRERDLPHWR